MNTIVITEFMDRACVKQLASDFSLHYDPNLASHPEQIPATLSKETKALIVRNLTVVSPQLLANAPNITAIGRLGVGTDNIDLSFCQQQQIAVYVATGANNVSVAEYVLGTLLILFRKAYFSKDQVIAGQWPRQNCIGQEIQDKTLGLIGYGQIAQQLAKRALAMGMKLMAYDPNTDDQSWGQTRRAATLEQVLACADAISLHVPLNDSTVNLIDAKALSQCKPGALLIQTSRGGVVDEQALVEALKTGQLGGAAMDVYAHEPLDKKRAKQFNQLPNLILTPHIAGITEQSNVRVSQMIAKKITHHLINQP